MAKDRTVYCFTQKAQRRCLHSLTLEIGRYLRTTEEVLRSCLKKFLLSVTMTQRSDRLTMYLKRSLESSFTRIS